MNIQSEVNSIREDFFSKGLVKRNFGKISYEDFLALGKGMGRPLPVSRHNLPGTRYIQDVSPNGLFRREAVPWHNDFSYSIGSYDGTMLYMDSSDIDVPTWFVDTQSIYNELSGDEKEKFSNIICSYIAPSHYHDLLSTSQLKLVKKNLVKKNLIINHPVTDAKSLYFSPATFHESNFKFDLDRLVKLAEQYKVAVSYKKNDIVIFDNLRCMHRRSAFEFGNRKLWRISFCYV